MRLLEHLVRQEAVSSSVLEEACVRLGRKEKMILKDLLGAGLLDSETLLREKSAFYKVPLMDVDSEERDPSAVHLVPFEVARRTGMFPIKVSSGALTVAVADPTDIFALDDLRAVTGLRIELRLACPARIREAIEKHYRLDDALHTAVQGLPEKQLEVSDPLLSAGMAHLASDHFDSPVAKTVQKILENASQLGASDVHMEPREDTVDLRYRIDGELTTVQTLPLCHYAALVARVKIVSQMDIAEQRRPQDGRGHLSFRGRKIDLRVSTLPTIFGEKVVIRLLNQSAVGTDSIETLGMDPAQLEIYSKAISAKQGMVLITGPTGSGKTTSLYSTLNHIRSEKSNITTIEDPIEYRLNGINQSQVNPKIGVTFSSVLRTILRQDPDVILVGEVRDRETADISFRSSLTGHLVFSTLHTNDAIGAVTRLYDLGLEPYLIGSAILCVVAQRLVRVICPDCRETCRPDATVLETFSHLLEGKDPVAFFRGKGCPRCSGTGFRGRCAIFEVLPITEEMRSAIATRASEDVLLRKARRSGFRTLADAALEKVLQGITTLEEALPFLPTENRNENDAMKILAEYVDRNRNQQLMVVRNDELARKIMLHAAPGDYMVIEPGNPKSHASEAEQLPILLDSSSAGETGSGIDPVSSDEAEGRERRRHVRAMRDFILQYRPEDAARWETAVVKNLSVGGCSFRTDHPFPKGQAIEMRLQLPTSASALPIRAVVRHCMTRTAINGSQYIGVAFDELRYPDESQVGKAVQFFLHKKPHAA